MKIESIEYLLSIVKEIIDLEDEAYYNDLGRQGIIPGCDCGCGGDSYTMEEWDSRQEYAEECEKKANNLRSELSKTLNIPLKEDMEEDGT